VFEFYDDPIVNESEMIVLLRHVSVYARKRESFNLEKGEGKTNLKEKRA